MTCLLGRAMRSAPMASRIDTNPVFIVLRILLGAYFLYVGGDKLFRLSVFVEDVANYKIVTSPWDAVFAYFVVWLEIVIGICLMLSLFYKAALISLAGLICAFMVALGQAWARGLQFGCGCVPWAKKTETNFPLMLGHDAVLLILIGVLYWAHISVRHRFRGKRLLLPGQKR